MDEVVVERVLVTSLLVKIDIAKSDEILLILNSLQR